MATDLHLQRGRPSAPDARPDLGRRGAGGWIAEAAKRGHAIGWLGLFVLAFASVLPQGLAQTPPTISNIENQTIDEDASTGAIAFTVDDDEVPEASLTLTGGSSNLLLVPVANIVFGGSGANRTVTVTPAAGRSGTATITVTVSDGTQSASDTFVLTVSEVNDNPTISTIDDLTIDEDDSTGPINFTVGDAETAAASLTLSATSSNPTLVPVANIVFGGSGANRNVTVTPAANENGDSDLTITVSDGTQTTSETFRLTVTAEPDAPAIVGSVVSPINDDYDGTGVALFSGITLTDPDHNRPGSETLTVVVTIPDAYQALGSFRDSGSTFTLSGAPETVTTALVAKLFDPAPNRVPVGQTEALIFTLNVTDSTARVAPQSGDFTVDILSLNDPPVVNAALVPSSAFDTGDVLPFRLAVSDPDPGDLAGNLTVTISPVSDPTFQYGTLVPASPSFTGTKAAVESYVTTVRYRPVANQVTSQTVQFQTQVTDQHGDSGSANTTLTLNGVNDPPDIIGVSGTIIRLNDDQTDRIFRTVRIQDVDQGGAQLVTVTVTPSDGTLGTLNPAGPLSNLTPAAATTQLQAMQFTPEADQIPVGSSSRLTFTITVVDSAGGSRSDPRTTVSILSVNGAPNILVSGSPAAAEEQREVSPTPPIHPFLGYAIEDDDAGDLKVTVTLDNRDKGELVNLGGFVEDPPSSGIYRFAGSATAATVALVALEFEVNGDYVFPPDRPGGTRFTLRVEDSVANTTTSALDLLLQEPPRNWLVTRIEDDLDEGSLRYALSQIEANQEHNSVITFALPNYADQLLRLDSELGPIVLTRHLTLKGPGADLLTLSGDPDGSGEPAVQLFRVLATVTIEGLTLTKGRAETGGAIYVGETGRLTLRGCVISDSVAQRWGGGVDVDRGSLLMENCLVRGNRTDPDVGLGGGGVAIFSDLPSRFLNTTFSANQQTSKDGFGGGALYVENQTPTTELPVLIEHCTFAGNSDASDGGTSVHANVFGAVAQLRNSVLADGQERNLEVQGAGRIVSLGGNVSDDDTRVILTQGGEPKAVFLLDQASDRRVQPGILGSFQAALRPVPGYPLAAGSVAIGRAVAPAAGADQVGALRDTAPDAGALEAGPRFRLALNEILADPLTDGTPRFLEFYVQRDSPPLDFSGLQLHVDGTLRHVFAANTVVQSGFGIIVAEAVFPADGSPVVLPSVSGVLGLQPRGRIELRRPTTSAPTSGAVVLAAAYVGTFVDPFDPLDTTKFDENSITLAPQFRGYAYLPHSVVLPPPLGGADLDLGASTSSAGSDAGGTVFGEPNARPFAVDDRVIVHEDLAAVLEVRVNDLDADGSDQILIVDVSASEDQGGNDAQVSTGRGALVSVQPMGSPVRGTELVYDPRGAAALRELPAGGKRSDTFFYTIEDYGTGDIEAFSGTPAVTPTTVRSPGHRLATGASIVISGTGVAAYDAQHVVTRLSDDLFSIPVAFDGDPTEAGSWATVGPRDPSAPSEAQVLVTVLGANDPPVPGDDLVTTDEETLVRIMGDPALAGSSTLFDTDADYPARPVIVAQHFLANDDDPDLDDDGSTLQIVGVVGAVHEITDYAGVSGESPVAVTAPAHGLADGDVILISGYGGHPSYNGFHAVTVVGPDEIEIPTLFVDNAVAKGVWTVLNDENRLAATSKHGAAVRLEIRADRIETSVVYNPRASEYLNGLAVGETEGDEFFYAVQDSHHAVSLAKVTVQVTGVNDAPVPVAEPDTLALIEGSLGPGQTLAELISDLEILYALPAASGDPQRTDVRVESPVAGEPSVVLTEVWSTDEETDLELPAADLLANDSDVDRTDVLSILSVGTPSEAGATVQLVSGGSAVLYRPSVSARLQALSRGEPFLDTFEITVTDDESGNVVSLVTVLVVGVNDTPVARNDASGTDEDTPVSVHPIEILSGVPPSPDTDADQDGSDPDDQLAMVPVAEAFSLVNARYVITPDTLTYDPTTSTSLNGLAVGQQAVDTVPYTVMDGSFVFANHDRFRVAADGTGYVLEVLANDSNLTGIAGELEISAVGAPSNGGTVAVDAARRSIVYSPEVNFVGDEVFTYTITDPLGNTDRGIVTVTVTVNALNGNLIANADAFTVALGEAPVLDVLANDHTLPQLGGELVITRIVRPPDEGDLALDGNRFVYAPSSAGLTSFRYEVSGGGIARAQAEVVVLVVDRQGQLALREDAFSVQVGSQGNRLLVLANDNILPGSTSDLRLSGLAASPAHGTATLAADQQSVLYTPDAGFVGEDTFTYVATDNLGGTGEALVRLWVGALTTANDFFAVPFDDTTVPDDGGLTELDVLANDRVLQGAPGSLRLLSVTPGTVAFGAISVKADGSVLEFTPDPGEEGEAEFTYTVGDSSTGPRTATGRLTVVVVRDTVRANGDVFSVLVDSTANLLPVLANDVAAPDRGRPLTVVEVGTGADAPNRGGTVVAAPDNRGLVYTPAAGFLGEETFTYTMTDSRRTDTARVVVRTSAGALLANDDAFTVFHDPDSERPPTTFTLAVLANDQVLPDFGQLVRITGVGINHENPEENNAPDRQGLVRISADGSSLLYTPQDDNPPYQETFTYVIADGTARRAEAKVTVEVLMRTTARDLETNDDAFAVEADSRNNTLAVLANDGVKPATATGWVIAAVSEPEHGGALTVTAAGILYSPAPGFVGTDGFTYTVWDGLGGTGTATVTVKVGDLPLSNDSFSALSGSTDNRFAVLANDAIRPAVGTGFQLAAAGGTDQGGTVQVDGDAVVYAPDDAYAGAYPYVETFWYEVEDDSGLPFRATAAVQVHKLGSDRALASVEFTVLGVNDVPVIDVSGTSAFTITDKETVAPFVGVVITEVDADGGEILVVRVVIDDPGAGQFTPSGGFAETPAGSRIYQFTGTGLAATAALQALVFVPTENYFTVPTTQAVTFTLTVQDPHITQPVSASFVVNVQTVNDPPIIEGTIAGQEVYYLGTIKPFASVRIIEVDDQTLQPLVTTLSFDASRGLLVTANGFTATGPGAYRFEGTAAEATTALRGIVFAPTTGNRLVADLTPPPATEETVFTLTVNDAFAPTVTDANTSVIAVHSLIRKAVAADAAGGDEYGYAVGASRNLVVIGAPGQDGSGSNSGSAYVRRRDQDGAEQWGGIVAQLTASDPAAGAGFGRAAAVAGEIIVIGAPFARQGSIQCGAVYVFEPSAAGLNDWQSGVLKLAPSDGANSDEFGSAVSVSGDTLVIGSRLDDDAGSSSGSVYVYRRVARGDWTFVGPKLAGSGLVAGDQFGHSVSLSGNTLVVGTPYDDDNGSDSGSAFVFNRNGGGVWTQTHKLLPKTGAGGNDGAGGDLYGFSVAVDRDTIIVGSPRDDDGANNRGSAYAYSRDAGGGGAWGQVAKVTPNQVFNDDEFGRAVAVSGKIALVGMPFAGLDNQSRWGAAFVFQRDQGGNNQWGQIEKLSPPDLINNDEFGFGLALGGGTAVVGAHFKDGPGNDAGAAYIYELRQNNSPELGTPIPDQTTLVAPFAFTVPAETFGDPDTDDLWTYSASVVPAAVWLSFDTGTAGFSGTPPSTGTWSITVTVTDLDGATASDVFDLVVVPGPALLGPSLMTSADYGDWISRYLSGHAAGESGHAHPALGMQADPDRDGRSNLEEYAFYSIPVTATDGPPLIIEREPDGRLRVSYQRRSNDPRLAFTLEGSADFVTWTPVSLDDASALQVGRQSGWVTGRLADTPSGAAFLRVRVDYH